MVAGLTAFLVIAASITIFFLYYKLDFFAGCVRVLAGILAPFLTGLVIAYLLAPLYNLLMQYLVPGLRRVMKAESARSLSKLLSVLICLVTAILVLGGLVVLVLPSFLESMTGIIDALPGYLQRINQWIENFFVDNPQIYQQVTDYLNDISKSLMDWASTDLLPTLQSLTSDLGGSVSSVLGTVVTGVMAAVNVVKNLLLGFIVAAYLLLEKSTMLGQCKQIVYAIFGPKNGNEVVKRLRYTNQVLGGFIRGKLLDSLIIGVLCFIGVTVLNLPYGMLVSVIVGVTNIIPFFGPIIGAVPCTLLILMHSPIQALYFVIFVLVLQQIDGNLIGPKILGNSTGLNSFWILFSILLFGGLFGFVGMLIGVPLFAVIYSIVNDLVKMGLRKRQLSQSGADYVNLDLVGQEADGTYTYSKVKDPTEK
jgi:predicted PurR-regulated permease PerM